jgi:hypothetical protein
VVETSLKALHNRHQNAEETHKTEKKVDKNEPCHKKKRRSEKERDPNGKNHRRNIVSARQLRAFIGREPFFSIVWSACQPRN